MRHIIHHSLNHLSTISFYKFNESTFKFLDSYGSYTNSMSSNILLTKNMSSKWSSNPSMVKLFIYIS
jgi:hypothetical protein